MAEVGGALASDPAAFRDPALIAALLPAEALRFAAVGLEVLGFGAKGRESGGRLLGDLLPLDYAMLERCPLEAHPVGGLRGVGELTVPVGQPVRFLAAVPGARAKVRGEQLGVLRRDLVSLHAQRLADRLEPVLGFCGEDVSHPLLGNVDRPPPQVGMGLGVRVVGEPEEFDDPLADLGSRVGGRAPVLHECDPFGFEQLATLAANAAQASRDLVLVRPVLEADGDLGVGGAVANQVRGVYLGGTEQGHLHRVEQARLAGADVPDDQGRSRAEVYPRGLVGPDVLDFEPAELHDRSSLRCALGPKPERLPGRLEAHRFVVSPRLSLGLGHAQLPQQVPDELLAPRPLEPRGVEPGLREERRDLARFDIGLVAPKGSLGRGPGQVADVPRHRTLLRSGRPADLRQREPGDAALREGPVHLREDERSPGRLGGKGALELRARFLGGLSRDVHVHEADQSGGAVSTNSTDGLPASTVMIATPWWVRPATAFSRSVRLVPNTAPGLTRSPPPGPSPS